ncbi:hypothetical protein BP6252_01281 [Coleophoma cylindrospora]|uniref:Extracellular membrane protein CFEM domain-containing protein n=1 Tax=Coleophoma cylindrospora TaxID=1849047 RepID=A0A3D8SSF1_9HELO|nr:hypothetical protein BP6252_01281 [Coleophoma cylindrospora]
MLSLSKKHVAAIALFVNIFCVAEAQNLPDPSQCADSNQSFTNCNLLVNKNTVCGAITDNAALVSCYCTQEVFSAMRGCESEVRQCIRSDDDDKVYESLLSSWQDACGPKVSFTPTTPALATYTPFPGKDFCDHVYTACGSWSTMTQSCSSQYKNHADYRSCGCQPNVLTQASVCQVDGAMCLGNPVTSSDLWSNKFCAATKTDDDGSEHSATTTGATTGDGATISLAASTTTSASTSQSGSASTAKITSTTSNSFVPSTSSKTTTTAKATTTIRSDANLNFNLKGYLSVLLFTLMSGIVVGCI